VQEHDGLLVSLLFERLATTLLHFAVVVDCVNRFDTKIIDALKVVLDLEFVHVGRYTEGVVIAGGLAKRVVDENDVLRRHPLEVPWPELLRDLGAAPRHCLRRLRSEFGAKG